MKIPEKESETMPESDAYCAVACPDIRPGRTIYGASAILVPVDTGGEIVWEEFEQHLQRTISAGLTPAVNMDTGYVHLLKDQEKQQVLQLASEAADPGRGFIAGAFVADHPEASFDYDLYAGAIEAIEAKGGTPILFPSYGLTKGDDQEVYTRYERLAGLCQNFYAFELGQMFAPFGRIFSLSLFSQLLTIPNCMGLKHSSLRRDWEWLRLEKRDQLRPDFRLMTGNDLAIDMVAYGSDYLLGLSTMAPDLFGLRDRLWQAGDGQFWQLNDVLQYLGCFAFRNPVPAYRHTAAQFLKLRGWVTHDGVYPGSAERPDSDRAILSEILSQMSPYLDSFSA